MRKELQAQGLCKVSMSMYKPSEHHRKGSFIYNKHYKYVKILNSFLINPYNHSKVVDSELPNKL